jgi:hypothetical protein
MAAPTVASGRSDLTTAAATLLFADAVVFLVGMFIYRDNAPLDPSVYDWPASLAAWLWQVACFAVLGGLVLSRRGRGLGLGLTVALAVMWPSQEPYEFLPSSFEPGGKPGNILPNDVTLVLLLAAGIIAGIELWRGRARAAVLAQARVQAPGRQVRVPYAVGGMTAAVLWFSGDVLNWSTDRYSFINTLGAPVSRSTTCCDISVANAWTKAGMIDSLVVLVLFAVLAAVAGSAGVSAGFLAGGALFLGREIVLTIVQAFTPSQSAYGVNETARIMAQTRDYTASSTPLAGFWIAFSGIVLPLVLATLRLRGGSRPAQPASSSALA